MLLFDFCFNSIVALFIIAFDVFGLKSTDAPQCVCVCVDI